MPNERILQKTNDGINDLIVETIVVIVEDVETSFAIFKNRIQSSKNYKISDLR